MLQVEESSFILPVVENRLYLAKRGTKLFHNHWCAVGGKSKPRSPEQAHKMSIPYLVTKPWGPQLSVNDRIRESMGREYNLENALREVCEELYSNRRYPEDFSPEDFAHPIRLGYWDDTFKIDDREGKAHNYFFMVKLFKTDFHPSPREVVDFKPLEQIPVGSPIVPMTRLALIHMRVLIECGLFDCHRDNYNVAYLGKQLQREDLILSREECLALRERSGVGLMGIMAYNILTEGTPLKLA